MSSESRERQREVFGRRRLRSGTPHRPIHCPTGIRPFVVRGKPAGFRSDILRCRQFHLHLSCPERGSRRRDQILRNQGAGQCHSQHGRKPVVRRKDPYEIPLPHQRGNDAVHQEDAGKRPGRRSGKTDFRERDASEARKQTRKPEGRRIETRNARRKQIQITPPR